MVIVCFAHRAMSQCLLVCFTQGYESMSIDPEDYENKVVLIMGRGKYSH